MVFVFLSFCQKHFVSLPDYFKIRKDFTMDYMYVWHFNVCNLQGRFDHPMTLQEKESPLRSFSDIADSKQHFALAFVGGSDYETLESAAPESALGRIFSQVNSDREKFPMTPLVCQVPCRKSRLEPPLVCTSYVTMPQL